MHLSLQTAVVGYATSGGATPGADLSAIGICSAPFAAEAARFFSYRQKETPTVHDYRGFGVKVWQ